MIKNYLLFFTFFLTVSVVAQNNFFYANTVDHYETVVNGNQQWRYFPGLSEPDSNWRLPTFNDASWVVGSGGIGYSDNDDATTIGVCNSLYMRKTFAILDTAKLTELLLSIDYDDGFVAYINNIEIARRNIGTPGIIPQFNIPAPRAHEANLYRGLNAEYFVVNKDIIKSIVKNGLNVLCVQVHNFSTSGADNDLTAIPYLMAGMNNINTVYGSNPAWFKPPFFSHLPILQVFTNNIAIVNEPKKTMFMRVIDNGSNQNHLSDSAMEYSGKIGIELHGASSINFAQKSYGLTTYDSLSQPKNVKLLGFPSESDYILYGPYNDKTLMRNVMMYDLARKMGWWAPRCRFIEMFLDSQYVGVYVFMEKIKIDKNRVAISQVKPNHNAGDSLTGGYIFKVDWNADPGLGTWASHVSSFNGVGKSIQFQTSDPNGYDITNAQRDYIEGYIDSFEQNLKSINMNNINTGYRKYIDVGSFIDYFILYEITHNVDAYRASCYFFKNKASQGGKLVMGPLWDFNYSLGNANFCTSNDTNGWCVCTPNNTIWWFEALNAENYYRDQLRCRWMSLYNGLLSPTSINRYIDSVAAYLEVPQKRHFNKWNILGTDLYNGHVSSEYSQEITWMKNWYRGRTRWVNLFMPGWHNPCAESTFTNRLIATEINYNSDKNLDAGNWIELYNNSSGSINLNNFVLSANGGANSKKFGNIFIPAFSHIVICEDTNLFKVVYPNVKNKIGNLNFGFQNNGGSIILYDPTSYQVFNILYSNKLPWPEGADGGGKTLEHVGLSNKYNDASNWFEGCLGGSPGRSYGRCTQEVNVTEICYSAAAAHNTGDWFEIKNNSNTPKNLSNYVFKDDDNTHSFTLPNNFIIGANKYFVICADTAKFKLFHPEIKNRIGNFNFGLSNKSDAIRLYTNNNALYQNIYYTDTAAPWPNGANGTGYTIELKNDTLQCDAGNNWTVGCLFGSPGKRYHKVCNPAQATKLLVSEINTNPAFDNNDGGWIELHNYDNTDLDLTDFTLHHNSASDTDYTFKEGTIIKNNEYLVLCNDTAKFKKSHPGITQIFALNKWDFKNITDSLIIRDFNNAPIIQLKYDLNQSGFAEANGLGKTLELLTDTSPANNNNSWFPGCFGGSAATPYLPCTPSKLIVTEINFKSSASFNQGPWFEIKNNDTANLLCDYYFFRLGADTTKFKFKPGKTLAPQEYQVISFDSSKFRTINLFVENVLYKSFPSWNSKIGLIKIYDLNGQLLNVQYSDTLPFPAAANGSGATMQLLNDTLNPFLGTSFMPGCYGGSPGTEMKLPCNPALNVNLQVSEINYKSNSDGNSGFWFELQNQSNTLVSLSQWYITNSNTNNKFRIPDNTNIKANDYLVCCSDTLRFKQQYPGVSNFIFVPGMFASSADTIKLYDYRGFQACKAYYSNDTVWPIGANGMGYTLENNGFNKNSILNSNWNTGCIQGSPGKAYSPCVSSPLIINEINYKPAPQNNAGQWLELKNISTDTVELSNYKLNFNAADSLKLSGKLAPSSYLVLAADSIKFKQQYPYITNKINRNFKLDTTTNVIRILEKGKLLKSTYYNASNTLLQAANGGGFTLELLNDTLNQTNENSWILGCYKGSPGQPRRTPCDPAINAGLHFSEICYHADSFRQSGQWVEIHNTSNQKVDLTAWVIRNSSGNFYRFPVGSSIGANNFLVCGNDTQSFHKYYPGVTNYQFIALQLNSKSDSISLQDYGDYLSCKAFYSNSTPWDQGADGLGRTLESKTTNKLNTSPSDWQEGCIGGSPGKAYSPCKDKLIVTEINYAPSPTANDGKWIEFFHTAELVSPITSYHVRLNDSLFIHLVSQPATANSYMVLSNDTVAFNKFHASMIKEYSPKLNLSNGKQVLMVYDQDYNLLQSLTFNADTTWDTMANGKGYTLELIKDSTHYSNANNWKAYCKRGSAGMATVTPCGNPFGITMDKPSKAIIYYPNPAKEALILELAEFTDLDNVLLPYEIINPLGKQVCKGNLNGKINNINIAPLSSGVYFIRVSGNFIGKFIKQ